MVWRTVGVRWTHGVVVSIGYAAVGSMLVADCPRLVMAAVLHESRILKLDSGSHTDVGRLRPVVFSRRILWQSEVGIRQLS
jgi:hypothetical protein